MSCSLCTPNRQEFIHQDDICWASTCEKHPDKLLIVLRRHTATPNDGEYDHLMKVFVKLTKDMDYRERMFRFGGCSIPEHYHIHQLYPEDGTRGPS